MSKYNVTAPSAGVTDTSLMELTDDELLKRLARLESAARYDRFARDSAGRAESSWRAVASEINRRGVRASLGCK